MLPLRTYPLRHCYTLLPLIRAATQQQRNNSFANATALCRYRALHSLWRQQIVPSVLLRCPAKPPPDLLSRHAFHVPLTHLG